MDLRFPSFVENGVKSMNFHYLEYSVISVLTDELELQTGGAIIDVFSTLYSRTLGDQFETYTYRDLLQQ